MGEGPPEFLRTHPVSVSRIAEAENRAAKMPKPEADDGRDFYLIQARLRVMSDKSPDDVLDWFDHRKGRADITAAEADAFQLLVNGTDPAGLFGMFPSSGDVAESSLESALHRPLAPLGLEAGKGRAVVGDSCRVASGLARRRGHGLGAPERQRPARGRPSSAAPARISPRGRP